MYPEYILTPEREEGVPRGPRAAASSAARLAAKFGWKIGDTFQLESIIPPYRVGRPFEFVIRGIYRVDDARYPGTDGRLMFFHYKYLYESTQERRRASAPSTSRSPTRRRRRRSARRSTRSSRTATRQTKTETEGAFLAGFISLIGNLALLLNGIGLAVTFTILLVTANTMSMAVRERRTEIAVLKTLGFGERAGDGADPGRGGRARRPGRRRRARPGALMIERAAVPCRCSATPCVRSRTSGCRFRWACSASGSALFLGLTAGVVAGLERLPRQDHRHAADRLAGCRKGVHARRVP